MGKGAPPSHTGTSVIGIVREREKGGGVTQTGASDLALNVPTVLVSFDIPFLVLILQRVPYLSYPWSEVWPSFTSTAPTKAMMLKHSQRQTSQKNLPRGRSTAEQLNRGIAIVPPRV